MSNTPAAVLNGSLEQLFIHGVHIGVYGSKHTYNKKTVEVAATDLAASIQKINHTMGGDMLLPHRPFLYFGETATSVAVIPIPGGMDRDDLEFFFHMFQLAGEHELGADFKKSDEMIVYRDIVNQRNMSIESIFGNSSVAPLYLEGTRTRAGLWLTFDISRSWGDL